ncbi:YozQ family protein [Anaerobacillus sp. CMMVII]|uniref:YozQ family protein n=1 Tax=Anaerobacillus sp. CMMVII TaxID=2755588 RepID=UPI0021B807CC|nr:YozQ family protein [Anaerobacillus sp. CMMVII]MCT8138170.1 YozQ family protein [Anaerobacillus sp. CMMVII]
MGKKNKTTNSSSNQVAENSYDPSDYQSNNEVDKGLAFTHEQVSDTYMEGTIDGEIDNLEEVTKDFPRKQGK